MKKRLLLALLIAGLSVPSHAADLTGGLSDKEPLNTTSASAGSTPRCIHIFRQAFVDQQLTDVAIGRPERAAKGYSKTERRVSPIYVGKI